MADLILTDLHSSCFFFIQARWYFSSHAPPPPLRINWCSSSCLSLSFPIGTYFSPLICVKPLVKYSCTQTIMCLKEKLFGRPYINRSALFFVFFIQARWYFSSHATPSSSCLSFSFPIGTYFSSLFFCNKNVRVLEFMRFP